MNACHSASNSLAPALLAVLSLAAGASAQPMPHATASGVSPEVPVEYPGGYGDDRLGMPDEVGCCDIVTSCGDACTDVCCCNRGCWFAADALIWWTRGMATPALATTGSTAGRGVLGDADTQVLFGDERLLDDSRFGGRFRLGAWLDDCGASGVEVTYLLLEENGDGFAASDADYAVLSRPIFNTDTSAEDALSIVLPGSLSGSLQIDDETQFEAIDAVYLFNISKHRGGRCDFFAGYRYLELSDSLLATQSSLSLAGATAGATIDAYDRFETENTFNGGLFGMKFQNQVNPCWSVESSISVALGGVRRQTSINGSTTVTDASSVTTTTAGGLLAQPTNIGEYSDSRFSAAYEVGVKLKRRLGERAMLTIGYTYLGWSNVFRAGDQIDANVNPTQFSGGTLTGSATPTFPGNATGFWAQGVSLGLESVY